MVRSSSNEDRVDIANPGGNESVPSKGIRSEISASIGVVIASYFSEKSLSQRLKSGENITESLPLTACLVQAMVGEGLTAQPQQKPLISGVIYNDNGHVRIQAAPGHGELIVNSKGNFDSYYVDPDARVFGEMRDKTFRLVPTYDEANKRMSLVRQENPFELRTSESFDEKVAGRIAQIANVIAEKYGMRMDIEFVYDPNTDVINIVQARPIPLGERAHMKPTALDPNFIAANPDMPTIKSGSVITPDILSAVTIENPDEILICNTIEEALNLYLNGKNTIKAVVVARDAPDTSHEAGMFTSRGIAVLQVSNLDEVRAWQSNAANTHLIVDPQHGAIFQTNAGTIVDGVFKSTLSPHITPFSRGEVEYENYQAALALMKKYPASADLRMDLANIIGYFDALEKRVNGADEDNLKNLAHILHMITKAAMNKKVSKHLFKELMIAGNAVVTLLQSGKPIERTHYLNLIQKFKGGILAQTKDGVISSSLIRDVKNSKNDEKYKQTDGFTALSETQKERFLMTARLEKFCIQDVHKQQWIQFCMDNCDNPKLQQLVGELVKLGVHEYWINTVFISSRDLDKLYADLEQGRDGRKNLLEARKIIDEMEHKIGLWADPSNFEKLRAELQTNLANLNNLLQLDTGNLLNAHLALNELNRLIDVFDKSIKALQISPHYSDKSAQVNNFRDLLDDFMGLLEARAPKPMLTLLAGNLGKVKAFREGLISKDAAQLDVSAGFSVNQLDLAHIKNIECGRGLSHAKTLADYHTIIHQNLLIFLMMDSKEVNQELTEAIPTEYNHAIEKLITSNYCDNYCDNYHPQLLTLQIANGKINHHYNLPLRQHSATMLVSHDVKTKKSTITIIFTGEGTEDERDRWKRLHPIAYLLIKSDIATNTLKIRSKRTELEIGLEVDSTDLKNIDNLRNLLARICYSTMYTLTPLETDLDDNTMQKLLAIHFNYDGAIVKLYPKGFEKLVDFFLEQKKQNIRLTIEEKIFFKKYSNLYLIEAADIRDFKNHTRNEHDFIQNICQKLGVTCNDENFDEVAKAFDNKYKALYFYGFSYKKILELKLDGVNLETLIALLPKDFVVDGSINNIDSEIIKSIMDTIGSYNTLNISNPDFREALKKFIIFNTWHAFLNKKLGEAVDLSIITALTSPLALACYEAGLSFYYHVIKNFQSADDIHKFINQEMVPYYQAGLTFYDLESILSAVPEIKSALTSADALKCYKANSLIASLLLRFAKNHELPIVDRVNLITTLTSPLALACYKAGLDFKYFEFINSFRSTEDVNKYINDETLKYYKSGLTFTHVKIILSAVPEIKSALTSAAALKCYEANYKVRDLKNFIDNTFSYILINDGMHDWLREQLAGTHQLSVAQNLLKEGRVPNLADVPADIVVKACDIEFARLQHLIETEQHDAAKKQQLIAEQKRIVKMITPQNRHESSERIAELLRATSSTAPVTTTTRLSTTALATTQATAAPAVMYKPGMAATIAALESLNPTSIEK